MVTPWCNDSTTASLRTAHFALPLALDTLHSNPTRSQFVIENLAQRIALRYAQIQHTPTLHIRHVCC